MLSDNLCYKIIFYALYVIFVVSGHMQVVSLEGLRIPTKVYPVVLFSTLMILCNLQEVAEIRVKI